MDGMDGWMDGWSYLKKASFFNANEAKSQQDPSQKKTSIGF